MHQQYWQLMVYSRCIQIIPIGSFINIILWSCFCNLVSFPKWIKFYHIICKLLKVFLSFFLLPCKISLRLIDVYLIFRYLQMRSPKIRSRMLIPTIQCIFLLYACLCSASRITDNRHHWWDVLAGAKIGILFASLVVNFQKNIILFRKWVQFIQSNQFHLIYSVSSCAKISKQKKHRTSSQWFQTAPQSTIDTQVFVVFYPNEPKMS